MESPFFSLVIPVYNRQGFIKKTIASCLEQNFKDYELIVVDDGSTDNTAEVIKSINNSKIKYVYQDNSERGAARNNGTKNSRGKYIHFIDSDDYIHPNHLKNAHEYLSENGFPELLFTGFSYVNSKNEKTGESEDFGSVIPNSVIINSNVCGSVLFIRRDIALAHPFSENKLLSGSEDRLLVTLLTKQYKMHFKNFNTYYLVDHDDRSMASVNVNSWKNQFLALKSELEESQLITGKELEKICTSFRQMVSIKLFLAGMYRDGFSWYFKSLNSISALFNNNSLRVVKYGILKPVKTLFG